MLLLKILQIIIFTLDATNVFTKNNNTNKEIVLIKIIFS